MNCEDFATIVNELAEGKPMDATARVTGLAHAAVCAGCASHLNGGKNVNAGLKLAAAAETEETPARVKESLLAAFAEHHEIAASPQIVASASQRSNQRTIGWWSGVALAAAAAVILALMLPSLVRVFSPAPATRTTAGVKETQPPSIVPTATKKPEVLPKPEPQKNSVVAQNNLPGEKPASTPASSRSTGNLAVVRKTHRPVRNNKTETETVARNTSHQYFPLTYLASATAMESGTVVRIQLSRSKLISLGLPMNGDRADELVKADLVLGDDGVARAIRLVE